MYLKVSGFCIMGAINIMENPRLLSTVFNTFSFSHRTFSELQSEQNTTMCLDILLYSSMLITVYIIYCAYESPSTPGPIVLHMVEL